MNSIFKSFLIFSIIFISGCSELKKTKVLIPASWINMEKIDSNIYVNIDMPVAQRITLLAQVQPAKKRVKKYGVK